MIETITQTIPVKPLSVNKAWKGRRFKTKEYDAYRRDCMLLMPEKEQMENDVLVAMAFYVKYPKMCDVDNFVKPMLDIIVKKGWLKDDRQVQGMFVYKARTVGEERSVVAVVSANETWDGIMKKVESIKNNNA